MPPSIGLIFRRKDVARNGDTARLEARATSERFGIEKIRVDFRKSPFL